jgi:hypothetical protein
MLEGTRRLIGVSPKTPVILMSVVERKAENICSHLAFQPVRRLVGCRPHDGGAAPTGGRRTQNSKRGNRGRCGASASDAMGISTPAVFGRGSLTAALGRDRERDEAGWSIAIGRAGFTQRRSNGKRVIVDGATASLAVAADGRRRTEAALRCCGVRPPRA